MHQPAQRLQSKHTLPKNTEHFGQTLTREDAVSQHIQTHSSPTQKTSALDSERHEGIYLVFAEHN